MEIINPPPGHGPWCGCAACQACNRYNGGSAAVAAELYRAQLVAANDQLWKMQVKALKNKRYAQEAELRDDLLLTIAALQQANAELKARLANVERMYLGYEVTRYAPPFSPNPDLYTPARERRSSSVTLAICGMLVALAIISQILLWFH